MFIFVPSPARSWPLLLHRFVMPFSWLHATIPSFRLRSSLDNRVCFDDFCTFSSSRSHAVAVLHSDSQYMSASSSDVVVGVPIFRMVAHIIPVYVFSVYYSDCIHFDLANPKELWSLVLLSDGVVTFITSVVFRLESITYSACVFADLCYHNFNVCIRSSWNHVHNWSLPDHNRPFIPVVSWELFIFSESGVRWRLSFMWWIIEQWGNHTDRAMFTYFSQTVSPDAIRSGFELSHLSLLSSKPIHMLICSSVVPIHMSCNSMAQLNLLASAFWRWCWATIADHKRSFRGNISLMSKQPDSIAVRIDSQHQENVW
jgi:hypothetical protein